MFNKPSCEEANASLEPSGENAGAPLCPGKKKQLLYENLNLSLVQQVVIFVLKRYIR